MEENKIEVNSDEIVQKKSNRDNIELMKSTGNIFTLSITILIIMAIRLITSVMSIDSIKICLENSNKDIQNVGIILLVEAIFMLVNLVIAVFNFIYSSKLKQTIMQDRPAKRKLKNAKIVSIIMSAVFTLFLIFETIAIVITAQTFTALEIEFNSLTSISSLVWTMLYTMASFAVLFSIIKSEKMLKENKVDENSEENIEK